MTPQVLRGHLCGYRYNGASFLFSYPGFPISIALRQVSEKIPSSQAAFHLKPFFRVLPQHDQVFTLRKKIMLSTFYERC
jgi:hypothetical protein